MVYFATNHQSQYNKVDYNGFGFLEDISQSNHTSLKIIENKNKQSFLLSYDYIRLSSSINNDDGDPNLFFVDDFYRLDKKKYSCFNVLDCVREFFKG